MFDHIRREPRVDFNWIITDDVASLEQYVVPFNLGKLVPLSELFPELTGDDIDREGLMALMAKRRDTLFALPQSTTENVTYYSVLPAKEWADMKHELTKPKPPMQRLVAKSSSETWIGKWMMHQYLPTAMTFIMSNSAIVNADTFWELRLSNCDTWRRLIAEHVPPTHQFHRRTN